jgi:hypothetical protein
MRKNSSFVEAGILFYMQGHTAFQPGFAPIPAF